MLSLIVKGHGVKRHPVPWVPELQDGYYRHRAAMDLPAVAVRSKHQPPSPVSQPGQSWARGIYFCRCGWVGNAKRRRH